MPILLATPERTLEDLIHGLGDVPLARIRVPVGNATEDDVIRFLDAGDKHICELIDGVLVEKSMGYRESMIAGIIVHLLNDFVLKNDLGIVLTTDGPIRLRPGRIRFPDVSFISWSQFPNRELPDDAICDAIPELAIEVIREGNTQKEMDLKRQDYFAAGVRVVWYLYPRTRSAVVFTSATRSKDVGPDGILDGGKLLPGFSLPLTTLFGVPKPKRK